MRPNVSCRARRALAPAVVMLAGALMALASCAESGSPDPRLAVGQRYVLETVDGAAIPETLPSIVDGDHYAIHAETLTVTHPDTIRIWGLYHDPIGDEEPLDTVRSLRVIGPPSDSGYALTVPWRSSVLAYARLLGGGVLEIETRSLFGEVIQHRRVYRYRAF